MEQYSEPMREALKMALRSASLAELERLRPYYQHRGGPGLELLKQELADRHQPETDNVRPLYPSAHAIP